MDQPLVNHNLNNNSINEANSDFENNIFPQVNELQNQEQYQSNQQNIDQPPGQPYYLSDQNTYNQIVKPKNSQENQLNPTQSTSSENSLLPPAEPYYASPQINSQTNNNIPKKERVIKNENSIINRENQNYKNFSEIRRKGVSMPNKNTFNISTGCFWKYLPLLFLFFGLLLMSYPFTVNKKDSITPVIAGICFF